uniref:Tau-scoloptoxin(04)-Ssm1b n=1 Tax=Scolopendra mutilans TaxID=2836329 RepID=TX41A_SCOMU|nr:RecName: Full=Tau-scoloptoxin(04)-Sm1b; Short=Tau-SLPTX(04)-Sm1b; AltName: Full=Toxin RhTx2; Contains: RecName: Full=Tau-scoloptoxin(04)-Sm1a; Short=Tau-SLPTX(04)-Sm1a; AltName: Full=Toxin RhTx; Flags: Precursor [Scolopendra mutilans]
MLKSFCILSVFMVLFLAKFPDLCSGEEISPLKIVVRNSEYLNNPCNGVTCPSGYRCSIVDKQCIKKEK